MTHTLHLHIGRAKTGTTAIQAQLNSGQEALAKRDSRYRGPLKISSSSAARLWASYNGYNRIFAKRYGDITFRDFEDGHPTVDPARWVEDIDRFLSDSAFEIIRDIAALRDLPKIAPA